MLVIAGLFGRSLRSLTQMDVGFDRAHLLTARVDVRGAGYAEADRQALYARLIDRLQALPGVRSVSFSLNGPLGGSSPGAWSSPGWRRRLKSLSLMW